MPEFKQLGPNTYGEAEVPDRVGTPNLSQAHPMLAVSDVDAAIEYYRKALGFFVEWGMRDASGATQIANLWRGSLSLFLTPCDEFGPTRIYCNLDSREDLDALHADLTAAEAKILEPPADQPWGAREMSVADLDGNEFTFSCAADQ